MSFYGNITNTSRTTFQFDKIYSNRYMMDLSSGSDGVQIGRYVLVEYDKNLSATDYNHGWYLVSYQGEHIPYGSIDCCKPGEYQYLYFNNPVENTHITANDIKTYVLYIAPYKHFTIQNSGVIYIKVRQNGSYTVISEEQFYEYYDEDDTDIPHAHIANDIAIIDNPEAFTEDVVEIYARVEAGAKYTYNVDGEWWYVEDETFEKDDLNFKVMRQLSANDGESSYLTNFNIDTRRYNTSRGYDSTVWQKVFSNSLEKYVMIAELNTVVPTFGVTSDAPSLLPISPHFGADTTNVYYDLHWQPAWGFRVKAANSALRVASVKQNGELYLMEEGNIDTQVPGVITRQEDEIYYPSDQFMQWSHTFENRTISGDINRKTLYYNPTTQTWVENSDAKLPAAIYFNKDGFNSTEITYSDDLISEESPASVWNKYNSKIANSEWENTDAINFTPTGLSGNLYNPHDGTFDSKPQEDIQEMSIMLPSIGNTIAQIWDLVYGGRDTNSGIRTTSLRNKDIAWEDAKAEPSRRGLRLVGEGGDKYNTSEVDTLAGAINTAHDLIGMIICSNTSEELEDLERLDMNRIYYDSDLQAYFRKHETYEFEELDDEEFEHSEVSTTLSEEEIQKGLYYTYNESTDEYELAEHYVDGTTYYIKKIANPYEEIDYELAEFPYTDGNGKTYAWYQDYLSENTRFVEEELSGNDLLKQLRSDYVYDTTYHPDREYFYIEAEPVSLSASYKPRTYWYDTTAAGERMLALDMNEEETRGIAYYTFNPSDMTPCEHSMIYVQGVYYFKKITGPDLSNDFEYELDWTPDKTQNGVQNVYKENGDVIYYQLNIYKTISETGEEIIYQAIYNYEDPAVTINSSNFINGIYYFFNSNTQKWERAESYVPGTEYKIRTTTYREVKDNTQVTIEEDKHWSSSQLAVYAEYTFYTQTKDTNDRVIGIREITRQRFINERANIFNEEIYTFGRAALGSGKQYKTINEVKGTGPEAIIQLQDDFYQRGTYHYLKDGSYVLDTSPQFTVGRDYYVLTEVTKLEADLHFYEEGKYYAESEDEDGYEKILDNELPADTTFYKKNEYYVVEDKLGLLPYGSKWNLNEIAIPDTITLGKKKPIYELIRLPNYSINTNTLNGMLIKIHQLLEPNDTLTRSDENLSGLMNQVRDLLASFTVSKAREFMIVDDYGRYHNAPFTGDEWLKLTVDGDPKTPSITIQHTFNESVDTTSASNVNTLLANNVINNTIDLYTPILDVNGHVVAKNIETVTLPFGFKKIITNGKGNHNTEPNANISNTKPEVKALNTQDTLTINSHNDWIRITTDDTNREIDIAHAINNITTNEKATTSLDSGAGEFTVQDIEKDAAGHITAIQNHKYTLPYAWRNIAIDDEHQLEADSYNDTVNLTKDAWLGIELIDETTGENPVTDTIKFTHSVAQTASSSVISENQTSSFNSTFDIPSIGIDAKGHVASLGIKTVKLPDLSVTAGTGNVVTAITYDTPGSGVFTETKANVGTLAITGFTASNNNDTNTSALIATDSINGAFAKLQKRIAEEETNRENAINALDVPDITGFGKDKTLLTLTETDGKIAATFQSIYITSAAVRVGQTATQGNEEPQDITLADWIDNLDYSGTGLTAGKTLSTFVQEDGKISLSTQDIAITTAQVTNFNDKINEIIQGLNCNNAIDDGEVHLLKSLSETNGAISYTSEKLTWSHISSLLPTGDNAFVTVGDLTTTLGNYSLGTHTHDLSIAVDEGESSITLASNGKYKLTAGGKTYIFTMGNFAAADHNHNGTYAPLSHEHDATDITSGTLNTDRIPDLSSSYAVVGHNHDNDYQAKGDYAASTHNHVKADITDLEDLSILGDIGTIDTYDASINPQGIIGQVITPAISDDPETPEDETQAAVTTQNLVDYIKWLEARITALENNS